MTLQSGVYWNNAVAKEFMYFHVSQAPSGYYGFVCAVCFQGLLQQLESFLYSHTVLVVVIRPYTFESRIHKVAVELPNTIEGLLGVQLSILFPLQICLTGGTVNTTFI